jgi:hypothetical protein
MLIRILTVVFLFICYGFSCDNCDNYFTRNYIFESDQNQLKKTYQVGEDILLPVEFSAIMGCENNIVYDNSNGDFSFSFQLLRIRDNNQDVTDGLRYFEITDSTLSFIASHSVLTRDIQGQLTLTCDDHFCGKKVPITCLASGYYAIRFMNGTFGEYNECQDNFMDLSFLPGDNNFSICKEINTTRFRINPGGFGGSFISNPAEDKRLCFFKVVE